MKLAWFVVHGIGYRILLFIFTPLFVLRFSFLLYSYFIAPHHKFPSEAYVWLVFTFTFPILLHLLAGVAEVSVNAKRKQREARGE